MTNVALAVRMDDSFASLAKEFVIMGGYVDDNMYQATGTVNEADINSDINLMIDPEAAKIALTANFPSITIAGNVANQVISTQEFLDDVYEEKNLYSKLMYEYYGTSFPFWDETAAALMVDPSLATNTSTGRFSSLHSLSLVVVRKLLINCDSLLGCRYCLWITFV
jgi:inosine-uridine nucleoside N-ribohydrolase